MAERSTIADKLLETLARQRDEGILSEEEYAARVEQLVRAPAPVVSEPVPVTEAAPLHAVGAETAPETAESGDVALDPLGSSPSQIELDPPVPGPVAEPTAPPEAQTRPDAEAGQSEVQIGRAHV